VAGVSYFVAYAYGQISYDVLLLAWYDHVVIQRLYFFNKFFVLLRKIK